MLKNDVFLSDMMGRGTDKKARYGVLLDDTIIKEAGISHQPYLAPRVNYVGIIKGLGTFK